MVLMSLKHPEHIKVYSCVQILRGPHHISGATPLSIPQIVMASGLSQVATVTDVEL